MERRYYACRGCKDSEAPWDEWAGVLKGHLTPRARRMACLAGSSWSFEVASARLAELCGVAISADVIRGVSDAAGGEAEQWLQASPRATESFTHAVGHTEFYTDGTCVNTRQGWREMRLGVFARRPAGAPAGAEQWRDRALPPTTARMAFGGVLTCEAFGAQWSAMAERLGVGAGRGVSALGDGAKWIWKQVAEHLPQSRCVVDVFHVSEHLHVCGRVLYGDQTPEARDWAERRLDRLIADGPVRCLKALSAERRSHRGAKRRALGSLIAYLTPNVDGLWYAPRLATGLPIGSGLVEGACKTVVGRRLKCNGARWRPERAQRMLALCCLHYNQQWASFWDTPAA